MAFHDSIRDPFGRNAAKTSRTSNDDGVVKATPDEKYVIQRSEDDHYLDSQGKPVADHTAAERFDSEALAKIWATHAQDRTKGTWRAVPAPSPTAEPEPDDDDPSALYGRLQQRKAA